MMRLLPAAALACLALSATAQEPRPLTTPDLHIKLDGSVRVMARQSDGDVVVGGTFKSINGVVRANLALIRPDGSVDPDWNPGTDGSVETLAVGPDDSVYVGGWFDQAGGAPRNGLARLRGDGDGAASAWDAALADDPNVFALAVDAVGTLYAGGNFNLPDGDHVYLATFAGSDAAAGWRVVASQAGDVAFALALDEDGGLLDVGGIFADVRGARRDNLARLAIADGSLQDFAPQPDSTVYALAFDTASDALFVAGEFSNIGGATRRGVARIEPSGAANADWDAKADEAVQALQLAHGALYVAGRFTTIGGAARTEAARLSLGDGDAAAAWAPLFDGPFDQVQAFAEFGSEVLTGGNFARVGGARRLGLARVAADGSAGARLDAERPGIVHAVAVQPGGDWIVGGEFYTVDGSPRRNLARIRADGTLDPAWIADTDGFGGLAGRVFALAVHRIEGYVIAGGEFQGINGASVKHLVKLSGATGAIDAGFLPNPNGFVRALAFDPNFRLYAAGQFDALVDESNVVQTRYQVARFYNGNLDPNWAPPVHGLVRAIALGGANVYLGGDFLLRKYSAVDASLDAAFPYHPVGSVLALATDGASLYVGGSFTMLGAETRRGLGKVGSDGSVDTLFAPATAPFTLIDSLMLDGAGSLYVGGLFAELGGQPASNLARLTADSGIAHPLWQPAPDATVRVLRRQPDGRILAAGEFARIGGEARDALALLGKLSQTIAFGAAPGPFTYGDAGGTFSATASSGLAVAFGTATPATCRIDPGTRFVTVLGAGDCVLTADQAGDEDFDPAPRATQTLAIARAAQAALIVSATPATLAVGATGALAATGGSGTGALAFAVTAGGAHCVIAGTTLTATAVGSCTVTATREGDTNHLPIASSLTVTVTADPPAGAAIFHDGFEG